MPFCSTGHQGFSRNLSTGEIVAQLWHAEHHLRKRLNLAAGERAITNVVMMGMGEPLQNYSALVPALRVMLDDNGYGLSRRRVTVSTSGVVPMIDRLRRTVPWPSQSRCMRQTIRCATSSVPLNKKYPIADCSRLAIAIWRRRRATSSLEYCMLDGVNDTEAHARSWLRWCA